MSSEQDLTRWLDDFAAHVRMRDPEAARVLFDPGTVSFGTRAGLVDTLDQLVEQQWQPVWSRTSGFDFTEVHVVRHDPHGAVVAAQWTSTADVDGRERHGRATMVFRPDPDASHGWLCLHTHFSIVPIREDL